VRLHEGKGDTIRVYGEETPYLWGGGRAMTKAGLLVQACGVATEKTSHLHTAKKGKEN